MIRIRFFFLIIVIFFLNRFNSRAKSYPSLRNISDVKRLCEKEFSADDCHEIYFEKSVKNNQTRNGTIQIDLYYDVRSSIEEEPSIQMLILDILSIQSIIFNLCIFNLIMMVFNNFKIKIRQNKFCMLGVFVFCFIGMSIHSYLVLKEIVFKKLTCSQHYEKISSIKLPDLIFCVDFIRKPNAFAEQDLIDNNRKLTYRYLDQLTNEMNFSFIFKEISYLNNQNEWIKLTDKLNDSSHPNLDVFYFFNKKCFIIKSNLKFTRDQFHFTNKKDVIKILFGDYFNGSNKVIYFLTKTKNSLEFSKTTTLEPNFRFTSEIRQESFKIQYNDKFSLIKNPFSIFSNDETNLNDVNKYITKLLNKFRSVFKMHTLILPLVVSNESNFDLDIQDQLFEQFYNQIQNITDSNTASVNSNFERDFYINHLNDIIYNGSDYKMDLIFNMRFFKKIILITNDFNYSKLILNGLNILVFWFNIEIFELYIYILKLRFFFIFQYRLLVNLERKFKKEIRLSLEKKVHFFTAFKRLNDIHTNAKKKSSLSDVHPCIKSSL